MLLGIQHGNEKSLSENYWFKVWGLRFRWHGTLGILSTLFLIHSLILTQRQRQLIHRSSYYDLSNSGATDTNILVRVLIHQKATSPTILPVWLQIAIVTCTLTTAIGSYSLLHQVPTSSKITSWIIPPHKEAFKRTVAIVGYLNLRLIHEWQWFSWSFEKLLSLCYTIMSYLSSSSSSSTEGHDLSSEEMNVTTMHHTSWCNSSEQGNIYDTEYGACQSSFKPSFIVNILFPLGMLVYNHRHFTPNGITNWKNGNTWIFVIPMWIAFNIDTLHQFPSILQSSPSSSISFNSMFIIPSMKKINSLVGRLLLNMKEIDFTWNNVNHWNTNVVDVPYLLLTLLSSLLVAFLFTLAFRGILHIRKCYWIATIVVWMLAVRLVYH